MKISRECLSAALAVGVMTVAVGADFATLTKDNAEVVFERRAKETVRFAVYEMTNVLSQVLAGPIPAVNRPSGNGKVSIVLGDNEWTRAAGIDVGALPLDGFAVKTAAPDRICIAGKDASDRLFSIVFKGGGDIKHAHATLFGVYDFLEKQANCRFYYPGLGTVVPRTDALTIPALDYADAPDFPIRNYYDPHSKWPEGTEKGARGLNYLRRRFETRGVPCCHGTIKFDYWRRFGESNPEYFALAENGKKRFTGGVDNGTTYLKHGQLCWSSGVVDEIYRDVKSYLTGEDPSVRGIRGFSGSQKFSWGQNCKYGEFVDVMPNDAFNGCWCEKCRPRHRKGANRMTDVVWEATAEIARRLQADGVKGTITQMAYSPYADVPDVDIPTNVLVMVARRGPWNKGNPEAMEKEVASIRKWVDKLRHKIWLWNYTCKYGQLDLKDIPNGTPLAVGEYYQKVAPLTVGMFLESENDRWFYGHLASYVLSRVAWRNTTDVRALLDEYYSRMYGAAANEVRQVFTAVEKLWLNKVAARFVDTPLGPEARPPSVHELWTKIYTPELIALLRERIERGRAKLAAGSLEARRLDVVDDEIVRRLERASRAYLDDISPAREISLRNLDTAACQIITNGDFTAKPKGRFFGGWYGNKFAPLVSDEGVTGGRCVMLDGSSNGATVVCQYLPKLKPDTRYRLSYFVKTENVFSAGKGGGAGAVIMDAFNNSFPAHTRYSGTMDWTHVWFDLTTHPDTNKRVKSYIRLVLSANTTGRAWFDGVRLEEWPKTGEPMGGRVVPALRQGDRGAGGERSRELAWHRERLAEIKASDGAFDLVFIGDAAVDGDMPSAKDGRTLDLRYPGDRLADVLWRLENGELDGYRAKRIVLRAGGNNVLVNRAAETFEAIVNAARLVRTKQPDARLELRTIPPSGLDEAWEARNRAVNEAIRRFADSEGIDAH